MNRVFTTIEESETEQGPEPEATDSGGFALTDLGNAERFAHQHGDRVRWDTAANSWRIWDGKRWALDTRLKAEKLAAKTARSIREEAAKVDTTTDGGRDRAGKIFTHGLKTESKERIAAMLSLARSQPGIAAGADDFDKDDFLLNCSNGIIDLRTGLLRPHDPVEMMTKLSPVEYHPDRTDDRLERFLFDATDGDAEAVTFLQKAAGYCLTGSTSEEKALLLYGGTATGKSTFLEALRACLGDYAKTINTDLLARRREANSGPSPELAGLAGVRLACGSEMESGRELGEAFLKSLTGGEIIQARHLYGTPFEYMPKFKIILALNHCPRASADDAAVWRRLVRVGIDKTVLPEKRDKTLKPYLRDPAGGGVAFLAWAVAGCLQWQKEGLELPETIKRETELYRNECDPLAAFVEDCLERHPLAWTSNKALREAYAIHCDEIGTAERYRVAPRRMAEKMKDFGATEDRRHEGRGWLGIDLKPAYREGL